MSTSGLPAGPYRLVTVNTAPERAYRLIGRLTESLKDSYTIIHAANCETIESVSSTVEQIQPDLLFCASMWSSEEAAEIQTIAKTIKPDLITYAIPHGLQVQHGPDAIVDHLTSTVPHILRAKTDDAYKDAVGALTQRGASLDAYSSYVHHIPRSD